MVKIQTQLCSDLADLQAFMRPEVVSGCDVVVLFSLGFPPDSLASLAKVVAPGIPVFLADCYGIVGFSPAAGRNIELMEAGRGREYGGVGGDGGQGVVAVIFSGSGVVADTDALPPAGAVAHMVVARAGSDISSFLAQQATAFYYGGLAKATYRYAPREERFEAIPYFFVSTLAAAEHAVGATSFTADVKGAVRTLLSQTPAGKRPSAVALFPCFMRGKNEYGVNNVEPDAVSELLPQVPVYGMFCHGELGPRRSLGFHSVEKPQQSCTQHSMTTIVAIHAANSA